MDALNSASNPLPITVKKPKRRPLKPTVTALSNTSNTQSSTVVASGDGESEIACFKAPSTYRPIMLLCLVSTSFSHLVTVP